MSQNDPNTNEADCSLTEFQRNRYFHGKLMTARDMEAEQRYHRRRLNTVTRFVAGAGILCGLQVDRVAQDETDLLVRVGDGLALDCCGNPIVVDEAGEETATQAQGDAGNLPDVDQVYLYLALDTCGTESVPTHGSEDACKEECQFSRTVETFRVEYETTPPTEFDQVPDVTFPTDVSFPEGIDLQGALDDRESYTPAEHRALLAVAREYYEEHLSPCEECTDRRVFLGAFRRPEEAGEDWTEVTRNAEGNWRAVTDDLPASERPLVYTNDMLYAAITRHTARTDNPHDIRIRAKEPEEGALPAAPPPTAVVHVANDDEDSGVMVQSTDRTVQIAVENDQLVRLSVPGAENLGAKMAALEQYVMDKSLKYKVDCFETLMEELERNQEVVGAAKVIVDRTQSAIENRVYTDESEYREFIEETILPQEKTILESIDRNDLANPDIYDLYETAVTELRDAIGGTILGVAVAQDQVCEFAERMRYQRIEVDTPDRLDPEIVREFDDDVVETLRNNNITTLEGLIRLPEENEDLFRELGPDRVSEWIEMASDVRNLRVDAIRGVGETFRGDLAAEGVETIGELLERDPSELSNATGIAEGRIRDWMRVEQPWNP